MPLPRAVAPLLALVLAASAAHAQDFRLEEAAAPGAWELAQIRPKTIVFRDRPDAELPDTGTALVRFEDWARVRPAQKKFLALYPGYTEPTVGRPAHGKPATDRLYVYLAQARFVLAKANVDLARFVTLPFVERIDPAIKHRQIAAGEIVSLKDLIGAGNLNPDRKWCEGRAPAICLKSSYRLEGKIPMGIMLINKLRDSAKKISDRVDFQSELAQLSADEIDQAGLKALTGLDAPVVGALEQNIFYVNQIMKFGKMLAVFQNHPADAGKTVVTAFVVLAIEASVLDKKREYEKVPVLRNLVPAQVLMGNSSFNSGNSISAGLPKYARNQMRTIAGLLEQEPVTR
jgi:hypothetical protein